MSIAVKLLMGNAMESRQWYVSIGLGNGPVSSGNKSLPETMMALIYVTIWFHYATVDLGINFVSWYWHANRFEFQPKTFFNWL